ncbi:MBL fold metallo-hydrolase [Orrella daihaiensis]|uniref:MBL fold metallo-hydrolase n=1 Tax=Orrella daihaiensis TaxID=2782176 RepID=A0ABY4AJT2_9BURK|nr:MBL fold metallo-hydrolase [Orrella daihaiensis]UOD50549.1 MBL fold metallo-hydrolase [Orrella daihaiensis]
MNPQEHKLIYPLENSMPEPGSSIEIGPGVHWIRMPLPFALDHINLWLVRDRIEGTDGWTIIDCGITRDEVKALWESLFDNVLDGLPVLRVVVTHMHPDHIGLAHWLCERWQAPLWMSMTDYMTARLWSSGSSSSAAGGEGAYRHFHAHGMRDPESLEQIRGRSSYYKGMVPAVPDQFIRLMDGDTLEIGGSDWSVISGYGHAPEHLSLFCAEKNLLISGDMVLPRISTNVSVQNLEPLGNPLPLYLKSLDKYAGLPQDTLVLPSHGKPFVGLHERIAQQHQHHQERLDEVLQACDTPKSTFDIVPVLFKRKLDLHQMTFAMGEAIAHLHALYFEGKLKRQVQEDGLIEFVRA